MSAPVAPAPASCPLCSADGGRVVLRTPELRVIHAPEPGFPAFYRVVWQAHVAEFTDLAAADRARCLDAVCAVEAALRRVLHPAKINLASLGNVVPHLHWHVIARFDWDSHFPSPVWAAAARSDDAARLAGVAARLPEVERLLVAGAAGDTGGA